jgi:hypothetical protein
MHMILTYFYIYTFLHIITYIFIGIIIHRVAMLDLRKMTDDELEDYLIDKMKNSKFSGVQGILD